MSVSGTILFTGLQQIEPIRDSETLRIRNGHVCYEQLHVTECPEGCGRKVAVIHCSAKGWCQQHPRNQVPVPWWRRAGQHPHRQGRVGGLPGQLSPNPPRRESNGPLLRPACRVEEGQGPAGQLAAPRDENPAICQGRPPCTSRWAFPLDGV